MFCYPENIKLMISRETMRCRKIRPILRFQINFYMQRNLFLICCFYFICSEMKKIAIRLSTIASKQTVRTGSPGCCKLTITINMAKLKMMKHQRQNISNKFIKEQQKKTKILQFHTLRHKY